jgi:hypothetical protein
MQVIKSKQPIRPKKWRNLPPLAANMLNSAKLEDNLNSIIMPEEIKIHSENNHQEELAELLKANLEMNKEILKISREVKSYMRWQNIWSISRLLLIAIPIILGFIYLPPLIKQVLQSYKSLLP